MKAYGIKYPSGLWYNNKASWDSRTRSERPQLFVSPSSAKSSGFGNQVYSCFEELLVNKRPEDRRISSEWRAHWKEFMALKRSMSPDTYWKMLKDSGIAELVEFNL